MAITHHFKGSKDSYGYGYFGYIVDGKLVLGESWPREGGEVFRGTYQDARATRYFAELEQKAPQLYNSIVKYYATHKDEQSYSEVKQPASDEEFKKQVGFDPETITVLYRVKLHMDNHKTHIVLVRGRSESSVVAKLTPKIPEVIMMQTESANVFAVHSQKISAIEFLDNPPEVKH